MAKRAAEEQITQDNYDDVNESDSSSIIPSVASADIMAKRKILKPRGRGTSNLGDLKVAPLIKTSSSLTNRLADVDKNSKIKALNQSFVSAVRDGSLASLADFRPMITKYLSFYASIESGGDERHSGPILNPSDNASSQLAGTGSLRSQTQLENAQELAPKTSTLLRSERLVNSQSRNQNSTSGLLNECSNASLDDSESDEDRKQFKIDGPKFLMSVKPTIKVSPFNFGSKPAKILHQESSDSEIEIKGPSFTFNKSISDPIFRLDETKGLASTKKNDSAMTGIFDSTNSGAEKLAPKNFHVETVADIHEDTTVRSGESGKLFPDDSGAGAAEVGCSLGEKAVTSLTSQTPNDLQLKDDLNEPGAESSWKQNLPGFSSSNVNPFSLSSNLFNSTSIGAPSMANPFNAVGATLVAGSNRDLNQHNSMVAHEIEQEDAEGNEQFAPIASLADKEISIKNGEEGEVILFQRRGKLMIFHAKEKENPYKTLGVGEVKVLRNSEGRSRVLMRADGGLRVLLNVSLSKSLSYDKLGNGSLVRIPAPKGDGLIETFVIKVKTPVDGSALLDALQQI